MAEQVQTGGLMKFDYNLSKESSTIDPERKDAIEAGYAEYNEKRRKRRNMWIIFILIILILFLISAYMLIKS